MTGLADLERDCSRELFVFPWWPEGDDWLHPEDVEEARSLLPGRRVFERKRTPGDFDTYQYGNRSFRAKPVLVQSVEYERYMIGDRVEVLSRMGQRWSFTGTICGMRLGWGRAEIEYHLRLRDIQLSEPYFAHDFYKILPPVLPQPEPQIVIAPPHDSTSYRVQAHKS